MFNAGLNNTVPEKVRASFVPSKPVRIVHVEPGLDRSTALSREAAIKQLTVHEKRRLIRCKKKRF